MSDEPRAPKNELGELVHLDRERADRDERLHARQRTHQTERLSALDELSDGHRRVLREASQEIRELVRDTLVELEPSSAGASRASDEAIRLQAKLGRIIATRHQHTFDTPEARSLLARIGELEASVYGEARRAEDAIRASESEGLLDALRVSISGRLGSSPAQRGDGAAAGGSLEPPQRDSAQLEEALEETFAELGVLAVDHPRMREVDDPSVVELDSSLRSMRQNSPTAAAATSSPGPPASSPESMRLLKHRVTRAREALVRLDDELQNRLAIAREAERAFLDEITEAEQRLEAVRLRSYEREEELRPGRIELAERLEATERMRRETVERQAELARDEEPPTARTEEPRQSSLDRGVGVLERASSPRRHKLKSYAVLGALGLSLLAFTSFHLAGGFGLLRSVATGERAIQFENGSLRFPDLLPPTEE